LIIGAFVLASVLTLVSVSLVEVESQEVGVVKNPLQQSVEPKGLRPQPLEAGLHSVIPFVETVTNYSFANQTYTMSYTPSKGQVTGNDSVEARTKDGQQVNIDASLIYSIDPTKAVELHVQWQNRYTDEVVRPVSRSVIRDAVSQFGVEEIVSTKRTDLEQIIT